MRDAQGTGYLEGPGCPKWPKAKGTAWPEGSLALWDSLAQGQPSYNPKAQGRKTQCIPTLFLSITLSHI